MRRTTPEPLDPADPWTALAALAVDPGLGGAVLSGDADARAWATAFQPFAEGGSEGEPDDGDADQRLRTLPLSITPDRLFGGLDITASLLARAPRAAMGLLAQAHGGVLFAPSAERLSPLVASALCSALDDGQVRLARDGLHQTAPCRFVLLAVDEGRPLSDDADGEAVDAALAERLAFRIALRGAPTPPPGLAARLARARTRLASVRLPAGSLAAICATGEAVGEPSLRAARLCARAACAFATLADRRVPSADDVALAAALVLGPRARHAPSLPADAPPPAESADAAHELGDAAPEHRLNSDDASTPEAAVSDLADVTLAAVAATLPAGVFASAIGGRAAGVRDGGRRSGAHGRHAAGRGPCVGVRRASASTRPLALVETLKAAAPWQTLRRTPPPFDRGAAGPAIRVLGADLRQRVRRPRPRGAVTLVVDASGSAAAQRLAEAKGAAERLLAACYARRDEVALVAFRQDGAEVVLPPTRSLTRVRRRLGDLAAGGATPLADGLIRGAEVAAATRDKGARPLLVVLTDGRANVARGGVKGRAAGAADAQAAARAVRSRGLDSVFIDISPRGEAQARAVADAMGARYLRLPHVEAEALAKAVRAAGPSRARTAGSPS